MRRRTLAAAACAMLGAACEGVDEPVACTQDIRAGLVVSVRDSATGAGVPAAGTTVIARDGAFADTAGGAAGDNGGGVSLFALAHERPGTYAVRVERAGYRAWERADVRVTRDQCHVRTVELSALLQR